MKEVILILGAGNAQIDAIEYCRSKGYEVCGCSYTTVDNGIPYLDYFEHTDIKSVEGVIEVARKYNVKAIYSVGSDVAMPTVMRASEALGLPHFIRPETAETCHSKSRMRAMLGDGFCGNVRYIECTSMDEALRFNSFPGMMKPTDSQGQRGFPSVTAFRSLHVMAPQASLKASWIWRVTFRVPFPSVFRPAIIPAPISAPHVACILPMPAQKPAEICFICSSCRPVWSARAVVTAWAQLYFPEFLRCTAISALSFKFMSVSFSSVLITGLPAQGIRHQVPFF